MEFEGGLDASIQGCIRKSVTHVSISKLKTDKIAFESISFFFFFESFYSKAFEIFEIDSKAILLVFYFEIEFIKGDSNSLPGFLSREFLQGK